MVQTFDDFITTTVPNISVLGFILNLFLSALLSVILSNVYKKYGDSLSNRSQFSRNFLLITMTTMLIITIVKSSLALSLGLVGALSIIRFRAAIKEPEELAYLFLSISIGLGLGANQTGITLIAFVIICVLIVLLKKRSKSYEQKQNLFITVQSSGGSKAIMKDIVSILSNYCTSVNMKRFDETKDELEIMLILEADSFDKVYEAKNELQKLEGDIKVSFLDNRGIM
jgi:hypothetical protein